MCCAKRHLQWQGHDVGFSTVDGILIATSILCNCSCRARPTLSHRSPNRNALSVQVCLMFLHDFSLLSRVGSSGAVRGLRCFRPNSSNNGSYLCSVSLLQTRAIPPAVCVMWCLHISATQLLVMRAVLIVAMTAAAAS